MCRIEHPAISPAFNTCTRGFPVLFEGEDAGEDAHIFGEDAAAVEGKTFLREVADAGALHRDDGACSGSEYQDWEN